jgi:hypothetical protein
MVLMIKSQTRRTADAGRAADRRRRRRRRRVAMPGEKHVDMLQLGLALSSKFSRRFPTGGGESG